MVNVFISHTSDMEEYPPGRPFIQAVRDAVLRMRHTPRSMRDFPVSAVGAAQLSEEELQGTELFLSVIGFRAGSMANPDETFLEAEFRWATDVGLPRMVFLVDQRAPFPVSLTDVDRTRVMAFRDRVESSALVVGRFADAGTLEALVVQSLAEATSVIGRDTRRPQSPWMAPALTQRLIERPKLSEQLLAALRSTDPHVVGVCAALGGAGGFGKSTLANLACLSTEVRELFPGGMLWVTLGEYVEEAELAGRINDLTERLTGRRPSLVSPDQAGLYLAEKLSLHPGRVLLVIDDLWTPRQLAAFQPCAGSAQLLITTRDVAMLPPGARTVMVGEMEPQEAFDLLTRDTDSPMPEAGDLVRRTGRWPVLLALVNGALRREIGSGQSAREAYGSIDRRLIEGGPTVVDLRHSQSRSTAVKRTVEASLDMLTPDELERYLDLAIFPEDCDIDIQVLRSWWVEEGLVGPEEVSQLAEEFSLLSLAMIRFLPGGSFALRLHDIFRSYLRSRCAGGNLRERNLRFLTSQTRAVLGRNAILQPGLPWWEVARSCEYLWSQLAYHLCESGRLDCLLTLLSDLRWCEAKIEALSSVVSVVADYSWSSDGRHQRLAKHLTEWGHILMPFGSGTGLASTILSRTADDPLVAAIADHYAEQLSGEYVSPLWALPDNQDEHPGENVGHSGWVFSVGVSNDQRKIVSVGADQMLIIWDSTSGAPLQRWRVEGTGVRGCGFAPNDSWIYTSSFDSIIRLWDASNGRLLQRLEGHTDAVSQCAISPDSTWIVSASDDPGARIWNVAAESGPKFLDGHTDWLFGCAIAHDGGWVATASADRTVRIWDSASGVLMLTLTGHTGTVECCAIAPDDSWLVSGSADGSLRVWGRAGECRLTLTGHQGPVKACAIARDGSMIVSCSWDSTICLWDASDGRLLRVLRGHDRGVNSCAFVSGTERVVTASTDTTVRLWDVEAGREVLRLGQSQAPRPSSLFRREPKSVGLLRESLAIAHVESVEGWVSGCASSPDGTWMVTGGADRKLRCWSVPQARLTKLLTEHGDWVHACAVTPDGELVVSGSSDYTVGIWSRSGGLSRLEGHKAPVRGCAVSPDGQIIASAASDRTFCLWDRETLELRLRVSNLPGETRECAFLHNGRLIATADTSGAVLVWDVASGELVSRTGGHLAAARGCTAFPDGQAVLTTGGDRVMRIWDALTGEQLAVLQGHEGGVRSASIAPGGLRAASVGTDQTLRIWDLESCRMAAGIRVAFPLAACRWLGGKPEIVAVGQGGIYVLSLLDETASMSACR